MGDFEDDKVFDFMYLFASLSVFPEQNAPKREEELLKQELDIMNNLKNVSVDPELALATLNECTNQLIKNCEMVRGGGSKMIEDLKARKLRLEESIIQQAHQVQKDDLKYIDNLAENYKAYLVAHGEEPKLKKSDLWNLVLKDTEKQVESLQNDFKLSKKTDRKSAEETYTKSVKQIWERVDRIEIKIGNMFNYTDSKIETAKFLKECLKKSLQKKYASIDGFTTEYVRKPKKQSINERQDVVTPKNPNNLKDIVYKKANPTNEGDGLPKPENAGEFRLYGTYQNFSQFKGLKNFSEYDKKIKEIVNSDKDDFDKQNIVANGLKDYMQKENKVMQEKMKSKNPDVEKIENLKVTLAEKLFNDSFTALKISNPTEVSLFFDKVFSQGIKENNLIAIKTKERISKSNEKSNFQAL